VQYLEHPSWKLRALNIAVLINNPSGKPIPAERVQSVSTLVTSAIGVGENRHVSVVDLPFAEEGAAAGEPTPPWWRQRWMTAMEQNALLALAGLLVLFGGVFPLLRRVASVSADSATSVGAPARYATSNGLPVQPEPMPARLGPSVALGIEAETVRTLVANDPLRTAQVIKEWIARDRSTIKRAS
jgi:flagellar biosynthesis/type III secretory pathway M-ring protein FliF/YscJ